MAKKLELKGKTFNRLTVIEEYNLKNKKNNDKNIYWLCKCSCGNQVIIKATKLVSGRTKSCGCYQKEKASVCNSTHRETKTRLYRIWQGIKRRCNNPNAINYQNYGARGIKMCDTWENDFLSFKKWAIENGYKDNLTIDRIDNKKNYTPNNCQWVTQKYQQNHRRNNRHITYKNETHTLAEWSDITGIPKSAIDTRLNKLGWTEEKTLSTPIRKVM